MAYNEIEPKPKLIKPCRNSGMSKKCIETIHGAGSSPRLEVDGRHEKWLYGWPFIFFLTTGFGACDNRGVVVEAEQMNFRHYAGSALDAKSNGLLLPQPALARFFHGDKNG